ncbi:MAG: FixH family protein [Myxococcota bacterium]
MAANRPSVLATFTLLGCHPAPSLPDPASESESESADEPTAPTFLDGRDGELATTADGVYALKFQIDPDPPLVGPAELSFALQSADGLAATGVALTIEPYMPTMGHGIPETPAWTEDEPGHYVASWSYVMGGPWVVTVGVDGPAGKDDAALEFTVSEP